MPAQGLDLSASQLLLSSVCFFQAKAELSAGDDGEDGGKAVGEGDGDGGAWLDEPPLVSVVFCRCSPNNLPQVIDFNPPQFGSGEKASPVKEATEKVGPVKEAAERALETARLADRELRYTAL